MLWGEKRIGGARARDSYNFARSFPRRAVAAPDGTSSLDPSLCLYAP